jgi:hypothetical protein
MIFESHTINTRNPKKPVSGDRVAPERRDSLSRFPWITKQGA